MALRRFILPACRRSCPESGGRGAGLGLLLRSSAGDSCALGERHGETEKRAPTCCWDLRSLSSPEKEASRRLPGVNGGRSSGGPACSPLARGRFATGREARRGQAAGASTGGRLQNRDGGRSPGARGEFRQQPPYNRVTRRATASVLQVPVLALILSGSVQAVVLFEVGTSPWLGFRPDI